MLVVLFCSLRTRARTLKEHRETLPARNGRPKIWILVGSSHISFFIANNLLIFFSSLLLLLLPNEALTRNQYCQKKKTMKLSISLRPKNKSGKKKSRPARWLFKKSSSKKVSLPDCTVRWLQYYCCL